MTSSSGQLSGSIKIQQYVYTNCIAVLLRSHWSNILKQYCNAICLSSRFRGPIGVNSLLKLVGVTIAGDHDRSGVVGVATGE